MTSKINKQLQQTTIRFGSISLTPSANGTSQSIDVKMYVKNRFACIVLRKQRRSLHRGGEEKGKRKFIALNKSQNRVNSLIEI